jgi:hypothetical protein
MHQQMEQDVLRQVVERDVHDALGSLLRAVRTPPGRGQQDVVLDGILPNPADGTFGRCVEEKEPRGRPHTARSLRKSGISCNLFLADGANLHRTVLRPLAQCLLEFLVTLRASVREIGGDARMCFSPLSVSQ